MVYQSVLVSNCTSPVRWSAAVRSIVVIMIVGMFAGATASAQPISIAPPDHMSRGQAMPTTPRMVVVARQPELRGNLGGGVIEFLFGDNASPRPNAPPGVYPAAA